MSSGGGLWDEKYSEDELEDILREYFGNLKLSELLKPCLITSYNIRDRKPHFFKKHKAEKDRNRDFLVRDVARATSAAPTYFEVPRITSLSEKRYPLIDGGVFANNPALCAYAEARAFCKKTAKDMLILSLGTGEVKKRYRYREAKDWGLAGWSRPVLDIMMSGVAETVDFQLKQIFASVDRPNQYERIQPELAGAKPEMDNAADWNLEALKKAGQQCAKDEDSTLDRIAYKLVEMANQGAV